MGYDRVFQGDPTTQDIAAPGTKQSPSFAIDVSNKILYMSAGSGWESVSSGSVNAGNSGQIAVYSSSGTVVGGTNALPNGTTATTQNATDASTLVATTAFVQGMVPHTIFSAAGTPLPPTIPGLRGARAFVSDATTPAFGSPYASGGGVFSPVYCDGTIWVIG